MKNQVSHGHLLQCDSFLMRVHIKKTKIENYEFNYESPDCKQNCAKQLHTCIIVENAGYYKNHKTILLMMSETDSATEKETIKIRGMTY